MSALSVVVTACENTEYMKFTLEGLCEQTVEDFEVLIITNGLQTQETLSLIKSYCTDYVGFEYTETEQLSAPAARNSALRTVRSDWLLFMNGGDYISPESIEKFLAAAQETKADILLPRYYYYGDDEPFYDSWNDKLAVVPDIDRLDTALMNCLDLDGRLYKRKLFDLYGLTFPDIPVMYNASLLIKCAFGGAKLSGCAGAIYERKHSNITDGFPRGEQPSRETLECTIKVLDDLREAVAGAVTEESGAVEADDYSVQEALHFCFRTLVNRFYRRFWFLDDECLEILRAKFEELSADMTDDRRVKLNEENKDLRFPAMYIKLSDAAQLPLFSLIIDTLDIPHLDTLIKSVYLQKFPFFEVFIRENDFNSGCFPPEHREEMNLHVLPENGFYATARAQAKGIAIAVKGSIPIDSSVLSEMSTSKLPRAVMQYRFTQMRGQTNAKRFLKHKGIPIG